MDNFTAALLGDLAFFSIPVIASALLARHRNRSMLLWGALGVLIIPIFVLLFLPKSPAKPLRTGADNEAPDLRS